MEIKRATGWVASLCILQQKKWVHSSSGVCSNQPLSSAQIFPNLVYNHGSPPSHDPWCQQAVGLIGFSNLITSTPTRRGKIHSYQKKNIHFYQKTKIHPYKKQKNPLTTSIGDHIPLGSQTILFFEKREKKSKRRGDRADVILINFLWCSRPTDELAQCGPLIRLILNGALANISGHPSACKVSLCVLCLYSDSHIQ